MSTGKMTVDDARAAKRDVENRIFRILEQFSGDTGLSVYEVDLRFDNIACVHNATSEMKLVSVHLRASLP
jgi:hypothetical protein